MLDFKNYKKLCSEFTHYSGDKFIELPKESMDSIGLWSLVDRMTLHEIDDLLDVVIWSDDRTCIREDTTRIRSVLDKDLFNLAMINRADTIILFKNETAAKHFICDSRINISKVDILKVDESLAQELIEKTREDRKYYCGRELAKSKYQLKLLQQHIEDLEALKDSI
jgi:hypothetical protein